MNAGVHRGRSLRLSLMLCAWLVGVVGALAQPSEKAPEGERGAKGADEKAPDDEDAEGGAERGASEAPAGYHPAPSSHEGAPLRELNLGLPKGSRVLRVPVEGTIDLGLSAFVQRALAAAEEDVALVVLDVNTLGGRVDAAIKIRDALLDASVKTVAYVHPRAISAGALISLACDVIAVAPGATIGAATPIQVGQGGAEPVEEKMVSYFRAEMRTTAESKGRRGDIAEAMVDASVEIEGLSQAGKLVTLDTKGALEWHIADLKAKGLSEVLEALALEDPVVDEVEENWAEGVVRFLTDPVVSGLLMSLGTLGILIELYSPGFGIPGAVGVTSILLFFGGHLLVNLAGFEELMLFVGGLALLAAEVFVIPGFGIAGILGITAIIASLLLSLVGLPMSVTFSTGAWIEPLERVLTAMALTFVGVLVALRYLPRTAAGHRLVLSTATDKAGGFVSARSLAALLDQQGVAVSDLRPSGIAKFDGQRHDVVSQGDYVPAGALVRVVEVEGSRVVVVIAGDEATGSNQA